MQSRESLRGLIGTELKLKDLSATTISARKGSLCLEITVSGEHSGRGDGAEGIQPL